MIGLMSGTSADGIDAVLLQVENSGVRTHFRQLAFTTHAYPKGFREHLLKNSDERTAKLDDVARLNVLIAELFADAAGKVARASGRSLSDVDLIGSHGQTIGHFPESRKIFGKKIGATLQIGDPSVIAKRTGVVTVGDFRMADIGAGGSGAPLVPYVDYLLFRSSRKTRALLNIGGIANITIIPRDGKADSVRAFDTGPGNMAVDMLMQHFFRRKQDEGGRMARRGRILPALLHWMVRHPFLRKRPPKSTGREVFGQTFVEKILRGRKNRKEDIIATVSALTALAVFEAYSRFIRPRVAIDELFVSGGGVHNSSMMDDLERLFAGARVGRVEELGVSSDAKEAIAFAILANEALAGNPSNIPGATGAKRPTVLGKICLP